MAYLEHVFERKKNISVVGIAGPGDPFANPDETMETLRRVKEKYPEMMLCLATNGLGIGPYIDELAELNVGHVTITVNAVDPKVAAKVYAWVRYGKRIRRAEEGVTVLLEKQIEAIKALKAHNITVKVNNILIPGINEGHIEAVAKRMGELGVDIFNCIPYYPTEGSHFVDIPEPSREVLRDAREKAGRYIEQMTHCVRCRADAVGCLGEKDSDLLMEKLKECSVMPEVPEPVKIGRSRPYVAVASLEGVLVNQHLGEAPRLLIYGEKEGALTLIESRETPPPGGGMQRWKTLAEQLGDCRALMVSGIGEIPRKALVKSGLAVMEIEGLIEEALKGIYEGTRLNHLVKRKSTACGAECTGGGGGCG
jgi:nitrogen fixation protein NifB